MEAVVIKSQYCRHASERRLSNTSVLAYDTLARRGQKSELPTCTLVSTSSMHFYLLLSEIEILIPIGHLPGPLVTHKIGGQGFGAFDLFGK